MCAFERGQKLPKPCKPSVQRVVRPCRRNATFYISSTYQNGGLLQILQKQEIRSRASVMLEFSARSPVKTKFCIWDPKAFVYLGTVWSWSEVKQVKYSYLQNIKQEFYPQTLFFYIVVELPQLWRQYYKHLTFWMQM